jgi:hypothetical protein
MKLTKTKLKQLIKEELQAVLKENEWDVSKRTAFPRVISQILSALREVQGIVEGGHLEEAEPVNPRLAEEIKNIFTHPGLATLKKLGGVVDDITMEDAYGIQDPFVEDSRSAYEKWPIYGPPKTRE